MIKCNLGKLLRLFSDWDSYFSASLIFLSLNDIHFASYADDNALYRACEKVNTIAKTLRMSAERLLNWFKGNHMEGNIDRFHLVLSIGDLNQIQI